MEVFEVVCTCDALGEKFCTEIIYKLDAENERGRGTTYLGQKGVPCQVDLLTKVECQYRKLERYFLMVRLTD